VFAAASSFAAFSLAADSSSCVCKAPRSLLARPYVLIWPQQTNHTLPLQPVSALASRRGCTATLQGGQLAVWLPWLAPELIISTEMTHLDRRFTCSRGNALLCGPEVELGQLLAAGRDLLLQLLDLWQTSLCGNKRGADLQSCLQPADTHSSGTAMLHSFTCGWLRCYI